MLSHTSEWDQGAAGGGLRWDQKWAADSPGKHYSPQHIKDLWDYKLTLKGAHSALQVLLPLKIVKIISLIILKNFYCSILHYSPPFNDTQ